MARLSTVPDGTPLSAVSLGTPHFSLAEFERLMPLLDWTPAGGRRLRQHRSAASSPTSRRAAGATGWRRAGVTIVVDTCTYVTAIIATFRGGDDQLGEMGLLRARQPRRRRRLRQPGGLHGFGPRRTGRSPMTSRPAIRAVPLVPARGGARPRPRRATELLGRSGQRHPAGSSTTGNPSGTGP